LGASLKNYLFDTGEYQNLSLPAMLRIALQAGYKIVGPACAGRFRGPEADNSTIERLKLNQSIRLFILLINQSVSSVEN